MSLEKLTTQLTELFNKEDYENAYKLLSPIKIQLLEHQFLVPTIKSKINPNDLLITRQILEIGAIICINLLKMTEFSNYITQLKPFYLLESMKSSISSQRNKLLSLYLLLLITQDDLSLFHVELENFLNYGMNIDDLEQDEFLKIPINFEKWIIDGDFNKIYEFLTINKNFPCSEFNLFIDDILQSIRFNIANNLEKVYKFLPVENLKLLLFLKDLNEIEVFISNFNWKLNNSIVELGGNSNSVSANIEEETNDEKLIIKNSLVYANEMERII